MILCKTMADKNHKGITSKKIVGKLGLRKERTDTHAEK